MLNIKPIFSILFGWVIVVIISCSGNNSKEAVKAPSTASSETIKDPEKEQMYLSTVPVNTVIVPVMNSDIPEGKNVIYSAAIQLGWDELKRLLAGRMDFSGNIPSYVKTLNRNNFAGNISDESFVSVAGLRDSVEPILIRKLNEKFNEKIDATLIPGMGSFMIYSFINKDLPFEYSFESSSLSFNNKKVKSFSFRGNTSSHPANYQYKIVYYAFQNKNSLDSGNFIIKLLPENGKDEIVIASVKKEKTLEETYSKVSKIESKPSIEEHLNINGEKYFVKFPMGLSLYKVFNIPDFNFDYTTSFDELKGFKINAFNKTIVYAEERIKFQLNERGAKVISEFASTDSIGRLELPDLIANKPFLLYLKEKDAGKPYLVIWVETTDILVPFEKEKL